MPKDALTRRRGRRPAGGCQEQTLVMIEQFSSMEHDAFHVSYLSDKIPEAVFHGQAVKTVAYSRVSTAQQDLRSQRLTIRELGVSKTAIAKLTGCPVQPTTASLAPEGSSPILRLYFCTNLGGTLRTTGGLRP